MSDTKRILLSLVRHGERQDRLGPGSAKVWAATCPPDHQYDPPISAHGHVQAAAAGRKLAAIAQALDAHVVEVCASPFTRCVQTAVHIEQQLRNVAATADKVEGSDRQRQPLNEGIRLDVGLSEWIGKGLFPTQPAFLRSPLLPEQLREIAAPSEDPCSLLDASSVEAEEPALIAQWPEGGKVADSRVMAAVRKALHVGAKRAEASSQVPLVVVVSHQFGCSGALRGLMGRAGKGWKHTAFDQAETSLKANPTLSSLLQGDRTQMNGDFGVTSISLMEVTVRITSPGSEEASQDGAGLEVVDARVVCVSDSTHLDGLA